MCPSPEALGPGSRRVPRRRAAEPPAGALLTGLGTAVVPRPARRRRYADAPAAAFSCGLPDGCSSCVTARHRMIRRASPGHLAALLDRRSAPHTLPSFMVASRRASSAVTMLNCKSPAVCQQPHARICSAPCHDRSPVCCRLRPPATPSFPIRRVERASNLLARF